MFHFCASINCMRKIICLQLKKKDNSVKVFLIPWNFKLNSPVFWALLFAAFFLSLMKMLLMINQYLSLWIIFLAFCVSHCLRFVSLFLSSHSSHLSLYFCPFVVSHKYLHNKARRYFGYRFDRLLQWKHMWMCRTTDKIYQTNSIV